MLFQSMFILFLDCKNLKIEKFSVNTEWMLAIDYYIGWLSQYVESEIIKNKINFQGKYFKYKIVK